MQLKAIKTSIYTSEQDLIHFITSHLSSINEGDVLALSTKLVSISEQCFASRGELSKQELIKREADHYLGEIGYEVHLTIKEGILIPSAGIDESNCAEADYLLYPKKPFSSAQRICNELKNHFNIKNLGLLLVDSHSTPLRRGTTGIALAYWGFKAVKDYRGQPDIYGKPLEFTYSNLADGLASAANLCMGEGSEQSPMVLVTDAQIDFTDSVDPSELIIPPEQDLYFPLFKDLLK